MNCNYVEIGENKWTTMNLGATTIAHDYKTCTGNFYDWKENLNYNTEYRIPTYEDFENLRNACVNEENYKLVPSIINTKFPSGGIYWIPDTQTYLNEYTGISGILFVDKNDATKHLFFPACGYIEGREHKRNNLTGCYWSSSFLKIPSDLVFYKEQIFIPGCNPNHYKFNIRLIKV